MHSQSDTSSTQLLEIKGLYVLRKTLSDHWRHCIGLDADVELQSIVPTNEQVASLIDSLPMVCVVNAPSPNFSLLFWVLACRYA